MTTRTSTAGVEASGSRLARQSFICLARDPADDPVIVEGLGCDDYPSHHSAIRHARAATPTATLATPIRSPVVSGGPPPGRSPGRRCGGRGDRGPIRSPTVRGGPAAGRSPGGVGERGVGEAAASRTERGCRRGWVWRAGAVEASAGAEPGRVPTGRRWAGRRGAGSGAGRAAPVGGRAVGGRAWSWASFTGFSPSLWSRTGDPGHTVGASRRGARCRLGHRCGVIDNFLAYPNLICQAWGRPPRRFLRCGGLCPIWRITTIGGSRPGCLAVAPRVRVVLPQ